MMYFAHKADDGRVQTVKEHLDNVSALSEEFACDLLKPFAAAAGKAHDIGKYSQSFQKRLNGESIKYEHSICGAIEYSKLADNGYKQIAAAMLEYCIAGHHTGLPDGVNGADETSLLLRLNRAGQYKGSSDYSAYKNEIDISIPDYSKLISELTGDRCDLFELYAFITRYVFSCLTDADYLDTEHFCSRGTNRVLSADFSKVRNILNNRFSSFKTETQLQAARGRLQSQAYENAAKTQDVRNGISILNMPTGSGKTLCSLKIAIEKLLKKDSGKKRIIYVIPYTNIIEQTAEQFEGMFGEYVDILQHHSNYCFDDGKSEPLTSQKLKRATENWDAPLIITTSVQFFQSFYHYKGSGLRKLHNIADSIIIFDEIHLLPLKMLQPCLRAIWYITKYMNSEAIMLSATMPDYSELMKTYFPECMPTQLITCRDDFKYFQKCRYINLGKTDLESVIQRASDYQSSLIIVNTRKSCKELYNKIQGKKYHLSTYMTPFDRSLAIKEIRHCLETGEKVTVVSTSLIEAGVDLDFETVFRQLAGLDSILQSGGRCNREGKRECGDVYIFETDEKVSANIGLQVEIARNLINEFDDITSSKCIETYYSRLFMRNDDIIKANTISKGVTSVTEIPFRTYAKGFEFIEQETIGVVIANNQYAQKQYEKLKLGDYSAKKRLQKYTVALRANSEFNKAYSLGILDDFGTGVFVLTNESYYNPETGFDLDIFQDIIV